jgi:hypothetical protein
MLATLVEGSNDVAAMAELARGRLRPKIPELEQALAGQMGAHQRFLVAEQLVPIDSLDEQIERISAEITERLRPVDQALTFLDSIPDVARRGAEILVAEIGVDMERFPQQGISHPGRAWRPAPMRVPESGAVERRARGARGSDPCWSRRRMPRDRPRIPTWEHHTAGWRDAREKRAAVAVGHSILVIAYHLLLLAEPYQDLGGLF